MGDDNQSRSSSPSGSGISVHIPKCRAADQWVEITSALGLENQRRAYRRSLGLEQ